MVYAWLPLLVKGVGITLVVALGAISIGLCIGLFVGIYTSKQLRIAYISKLLDGYVLLMRGTPQYVQLLMIYYVLPELIGINVTPLVAGIVALGLNESAYSAEIIRGGINALPEGQWHATEALGYSTFVSMKDIVLPQVMRAVFPTLSNELAVMLKDTSIVSVIGLIEITQIGKNLVATTLKPLEVYGLIALIYLILTTSVTSIAGYLEKGRKQ